MADDGDYIRILPVAAESYAHIWREAAKTELGLIVEVDGEQNVIYQAYKALYSTRAELAQSEPSLDIGDFYLTLPKDLDVILIVRQPKAQLE